MQHQGHERGWPIPGAREQGATDFLRADPKYDQGITGTMKTAHLAEAYGLDLEIHAAGPAQRHLMAAIRNSNFYELSLVAPRRAEPDPRHLRLRLLR